jgi:putative hemolysin
MQLMTLIEEKPTIIAQAGAAYRMRLAQSAEDVWKAQRLRFEVFNLELGEGLAASHALERDVDAFDEVCDHLIVEESATGEVVGTYRLQTGAVAKANIGYYSQREFDFTVYEPWRSEMIELGRACVHKAHRNFNLLHLLWRGIAQYAVAHKARFLVGCSSLTSQNPQEGLAVYEQLRGKFLVRPMWQTFPHPIYACVVAGGADPGGERRDYTLSQPGSTPPATTKLLRAYLAIGAKICGPPAIDREFGTIDFLTMLDLQALPMIVRAHFLK